MGKGLKKKTDPCTPLTEAQDSCLEPAVKGVYCSVCFLELMSQAGFLVIASWVIGVVARFG